MFEFWNGDEKIENSGLFIKSVGFGFEIGEFRVSLDREKFFSKILKFDFLFVVLDGDLISNVHIKKKLKICKFNYECTYVMTDEL